MRGKKQKGNNFPLSHLMQFFCEQGSLSHQAGNAIFGARLNNLNYVCTMLAFQTTVTGLFLLFLGETNNISYFIYFIFQCFSARNGMSDSPSHILEAVSYIYTFVLHFSIIDHKRGCVKVDSSYQRHIYLCSRFQRILGLHPRIS